MLTLRSRAFPLLCFATWVAASSSAQVHPQDQPLYTDIEVRVSGLPSLMAKSHDPADVLPTALDIILRDRSICCGRDSALEDSVERADPSSLKDIASKLQGRHLLSDGRPIAVTAEIWPPESVEALGLLKTFNDKHAFLMLWNEHIYVLDGMVYRWASYSADTGPYTVIRKLLLVNPRFADARRLTEYNPESDDLRKVQGLLLVKWTAQ